MENKITRFIYDYSPIFLQHLFTSFYGWQKVRERYNAHFRKMYRFYKESFHWPEEKLREYQRQQIRRVVSEAYRHVPFYRERFDSLGLRPEDIRGPEDLQKLPLLTKEEVRSADRRMVSTRLKPWQVKRVTTSGSTGFPMNIYHGPNDMATELAFAWARRYRGFRRGQRYATFTGLQLIPNRQKGPPYWRQNVAMNQRCYSVFHISDETIPYYLEDLERFRPAYILGYASAVYLLAEFILRKGWRLRYYPRVFFSCCEELHDFQRDAIARAFRCRVYDHYGMGEHGASITEYDCGHKHLDLDYSYVELIPVDEEDGLVVAEVVCTTFINEAWPLIRYRSGDLVLYDPDEPPCPHGVPGPIIRKIYGRTAHCIIDKRGRKFPNVSVIFKKCRNMRAAQVVQERVGEIIVRVVRDDGYTEEDEKNLYRQFRAKFGDDLDITVEYVDDIERTSRGKCLMIISRIRDGSGAE